MPLVLLIRAFPSFFNFLLLLLNQEPLHRIIVIVIPHQQRQLLLLRQRWPPVLFLTALFFLNILPFPLQDVLPSYLELLRVIVIPGRVPRMIYSDRSFRDLCTAEVVHRQIGTALVLVLEPSETLGFASLLVAREFQKRRIAKLGENRDYVAF